MVDPSGWSSSLSSFLPSLCLLAVFSGVLFHLFFLTLLLRWVVTSSVIIWDSFCCCCLEYSLIAGCRGLWDISPFRLLSLKFSCCFHGDSRGNRDKWMCLICLFVFFYSLLIYFSVLGLCCCVSCSLVVLSGGYSSCYTQASHCGGFSCGAQALGNAGFSSCCYWPLEHRVSSCGDGLSCLEVCGILIPWAGIEPSPLHWKVDPSPLDHQGSPSSLVCTWLSLPLPVSSLRAGIASLFACSAYNTVPSAYCQCKLTLKMELSVLLFFFLSLPIFLAPLFA